MPEFTPKTTAAYLAETLDWMQECIDYCGKVTDGSGTFDPADPRYLRAVIGSVSAFQIAVLTEAVRLLDPEVSERLTAEIDSALDDGGVVGELLWEWQEHRAAGRPISAPSPRHPAYKNIWRRALDSREGEALRRA